MRHCRRTAELIIAEPRLFHVTDNIPLSVWVLVWIATASVVVFYRWKLRTASAGLVFAYLLNFWLIHWVAAALYLLPWNRMREMDLTRLGMEQSTYGVIAFAFGSLVLAPRVLKAFPRATTSPVAYLPHSDLKTSYLLLGALSYIILTVGVGRIPSI